MALFAPVRGRAALPFDLASRDLASRRSRSERNSPVKGLALFVPLYWHKLLVV